jgi:UDP-N-acetylmuramoylalanine--D-glutamate ligase
MAMTEAGFAGKRIVILGLARQGLALARFFVANGAQVTISDATPAERLAAEIARLGDLPVELALGGHPLTLLDGCDLLCLSGGVPPQIAIVQEAIARGVPLSNDSLLTFQLAQRRGLGPLAAITGSSGKTTTTSLVGEMLKASGYTVHVGGNIGAPLIDRLDGIRAGEPIVLELSSFQLELFDPALAWGELDGVGPDVAAILNVTPNHLDRHPGMAAYAAAKFNLLRTLPAGASLVLSADDPVTAALLAQDAGAVRQAVPEQWAMDDLLAATRDVLTTRSLACVPFSRMAAQARGAWLEGDMLVYGGQPLCSRSEVRLRGAHNLSNMLAAAAISGAIGATAAGMATVARTFSGVPHRLEIVAEAGGAMWVNDSIATSPERAIAGLRSFSTDAPLILLAGGKDKNLPWDDFADVVIERVADLIGFGQAGAMIVEKVQARAALLGSRAPNCAVTQRLDDAVMLAARAVTPGAVVLLSPGGTSYDSYRDFEERGEHFRQLVRELARTAEANAAEQQRSGNVTVSGGGG